MPTLNKQNPTDTREWKALVEHQKQMISRKLSDLFRSEDGRAAKYSIETEEIFLDYSKNRITERTLHHLIALAEKMGVADGIRSMFSGEKINETENRAVLHVALRNRSSDIFEVDGEEVNSKIASVLEHIRLFAESLDQGEWLGYTGKQITDVINIGIGGSDLGVLMVTEALTPYHLSDRNVHFVSNVDGAHIHQTLRKVDPETTLFVVASKSFTTIETMTNAHTARQWLLSSGAMEEDVRKHFVAVSTNLQLVTKFGIDKENMFGFWDWVGGRFSLSSAVGLSIVLAVGFRRFEELLEGMHIMDRHFSSTELAQNMPVLLALLSIWYASFWHAETEAVLPYAQDLQHFPTYLQQASMESNGKCIGRDGSPIKYATGSVLWGGPGTNSQHSFYQLLHQGTQLIPSDFIIVANPHHNLHHHHQILVANALAQAEALMVGRTKQQVRHELEGKKQSKDEIDRLVPFKVFNGNRPSNTLLIRKLTPRALGSLIALYEHKIFVQGLIWNIYSFDQFGVELGKELAKNLQPELTGQERPDQHDESTNALLQKYKQWQE